MLQKIHYAHVQRNIISLAIHLILWKVPDFHCTTDWSPLFTKCLAWPAVLQAWSCYPPSKHHVGLVEARNPSPSQLNSWSYLPISNLNNIVTVCMTSFTQNWTDWLIWEVTVKQTALSALSDNVLSEAQADYYLGCLLQFCPVKGTIYFYFLWI